MKRYFRVMRNFGDNSLREINIDDWRFDRKTSNYDLIKNGMTVETIPEREIVYLEETPKND